MGLSISWVAVRGMFRADVLAVLDMVDTDRPAPDYPAGVGLADGGHGWLVLLSDDLDFASPELLAKLSAGGVAVGGQEEDRVMFSQARGFSNGVQTWCITHDSEKGLRHLDVIGEPPAAFAAVLAKVAAEQDEEPDGPDFFFEAPLEAAAAVCGIRPLSPDYPDLRYMALQRASAARRQAASEAKPRGFFAKLFGR